MDPKRDGIAAGVGLMTSCAVVHDAPVIWNLYTENETEGLVGIKKLLTEEYYGWGVRREDTELLDKINAVLKKWKEDGTLDKTVTHWMPYL